MKRERRTIFNKHEHDFRSHDNSSAGYYGIILYCRTCGKAFTYNEEWILYPLWRID